MQRSAIFTLALALGLAIPMIGTQAAPAEAAVRIYIPAPVVVVGGTNRQHTDRDYNRREERAEAQERREARERRIAYERRITYERREQREERHEYQTARWAPVRRDEHRDQRDHREHRGD